MDRVTPTLTILAIVLVVFTLIALGWRARRRRHAGLPAPASPPAALDDALLAVDGFYVATTIADAPTDRVAVHGLAFRGRAGVAVHPEGVVLMIAGAPDVFLARDALVGVGRATWTIDRVVGRDGLVFVRWTLGGTAVDTYLKVADPDALVVALETVVPEKEAA